MSPNRTVTPMFFDTTTPNTVTPSALQPAYWKLIQYASLPRPEGTAPTLKNRLRTLGVHVKTTATAKHCEKLLQRFDRGHLTYETLSTTALQTFAKDRRLPCKPECSQHDQIVKLLEKADDEQTFEKFLDLPCELRLMVYEFHLEGLELPKGRGSARTPPLCRESSLLREEALPLLLAKEKKE